MQYLGGKARSAKTILSYVLKDRKVDQPYYEPFVGAGNVIWQVKGGPRYGNDVNRYVIELLKAIANGWVPPINVSEELYNTVKANPSQYPPELVGFIGFGCSFGGKWFGGYARQGTTTSRPDGNYARVAGRALDKQRKGLKDVTFSCLSYQDLIVPANSIVYCDPPYAGSTEYKDKNFDHDLFWFWSRMTALDSDVFVTEYNAPSDFKCLWERNVKVQLNIQGGRQRVDRLFWKRGR